MDGTVREYLAEIGRRGGKRSRRKLDADTARRMVAIREARRAYRRFHAQCFWSYDPDYLVHADDVRWVADELMKNGGRAAWEAAARLCP